MLSEYQIFRPKVAAQPPKPVEYPRKILRFKADVKLDVPPVFVGKRSQPVNISGSLLRSHPYRRDIAVFIKLRSVVGKAEELYSGFYRVFYILPLVTDRMVTPRSVSVIICCHHFGIISFCLSGAAEPGTDGNMISHIPPFVVP